MRFGGPMLVSDTDTLPASDRVEAPRAPVGGSRSPSTAAVVRAGTVRARLHVVELGPVTVVTTDAAGGTIRYTPRRGRAADRCAVVLALPGRATGHLSPTQEERAYGPPDMVLTDVSALDTDGWRGFGASYAFRVDAAELGLPMDTVRAAARTLHASPLYPLVRDHIANVAARATEIAGTAAATQVGLASVTLVRALIVSAAEDAARLGDAVHASLAARVQAYVQHHVRDLDLGPATIAAANGVSVRALYALYEALGTSLEQSIVRQRLEGARGDLAAPRHRHRPIAVVARDWGFTNPSFFSRRFRQAFGVTPRQWRSQHAAPAPR